MGEGTRTRAWEDRNRTPDHGRWLRDWQNQGCAPDEFVKIVRRKLTKKQAQREELVLITLYRKQGARLFNDGERTYENKWLPNLEFGKLG